MLQPERGAGTGARAETRRQEPPRAFDASAYAEGCRLDDLDGIDVVATTGLDASAFAKRGWLDDSWDGIDEVAPTGADRPTPRSGMPGDQGRDAKTLAGVSKLPETIETTVDSFPRPRTLPALAVADAPISPIRSPMHSPRVRTRVRSHVRVRRTTSRSPSSELRSPVHVLRTTSRSPSSGLRVRSPIRKRNERGIRPSGADKAIEMARALRAGLLRNLESSRSVLVLAQQTVDECGQAIFQWFGSLSGPALQSAIQEAFSRFDQDGSGVIDREEFAKAMHTLGLRLSTANLDILFREYDADGSGEIDLGEFSNMVLSLLAKEQAKRKEAAPWQEEADSASDSADVNTTTDTATCTIQGSAATCTIEGSVATVAVTAGGSGYSIAPTVQFNAVGGGSGATGIATISGGVVTGVVITNVGDGYTTAPTVQFNAVSGGSGATATATISTLASETVSEGRGNEETKTSKGHADSFEVDNFYEIASDLLRLPGPGKEVASRAGRGGATAKLPPLDISDVQAPQGNARLEGGRKNSISAREMEPFEPNVVDILPYFPQKWSPVGAWRHRHRVRPNRHTSNALMASQQASNALMPRAPTRTRREIREARDLRTRSRTASPVASQEMCERADGKGGDQDDSTRRQALRQPECKSHHSTIGRPDGMPSSADVKPIKVPRLMLRSDPTTGTPSAWRMQNQGARGSRTQRLDQRTTKMDRDDFLALLTDRAGGLGWTRSLFQAAANVNEASTTRASGSERVQLTERPKRRASVIGLEAFEPLVAAQQGRKAAEDTEARAAMLMSKMARHRDEANALSEELETLKDTYEIDRRRSLPLVLRTSDELSKLVRVTSFRGRNFRVHQ
jgi:hypothetical protein